MQKDKKDNSRGSIQLKLDEVLKNFDDPLLEFTQGMLNLKQNYLPDKINVI